MNLAATLRGTTYRFRDLKQVLAKANEEKSGDRLAGVAAESVSASAPVLPGSWRHRARTVKPSR